MTEKREKPIRLSKQLKLFKGMIRVYGFSRQGTGRAMNQDRLTVKEIGDGRIITAVADGMGGESGGNIAAEMAIRGITRIDTVQKGNEIDSLAQAVKKIDVDILDTSIRQPALTGMGTTLTAVAIGSKKAHFAHVGDSRLFLFREGNLKQITRDQTFAQFLFKEGEITQEQISTHYSRHILDQCVGHGECEPQTGSFSIKQNDLLLLSSDGLHKTLNTDRLERLLAIGQSLKKTCDMLVEKVLRSGGTDDITLLLIHL